MRKLALGIATAATVFTAVPALAQVGFYVGPGGPSVEVGPPYRHYGGPSWRHHYGYGWNDQRYYGDRPYRYRDWDY
ncbi:MAG: hypothetical protein V7608_1856 [Hyphomicrobiales bacterium]|jgi:hypothetical protein